MPQLTIEMHSDDKNPRAVLCDSLEDAKEVLKQTLDASLKNGLGKLENLKPGQSLEQPILRIVYHTDEEWAQKSKNYVDRRK